MNKSYTYGIIALALVAIVLAGTSFLVKNPSQPSAAPVTTAGNSASVATINTVAGGTQNTAAVAQAVKVGETKNITWQAADFPSANVKVNIIRKTGDNPASYELIRVISASTANTGSIAWTPSANELGSDVYVEIGCVNTTTACHATRTPALTVSK